MRVSRNEGQAAGGERSTPGNVADDCYGGKDERSSVDEERGCNNSVRESPVVSSLVPYRRATMPF